MFCDFSLSASEWSAVRAALKKQGMTEADFAAGLRSFIESSVTSRIGKGGVR